jgi:hypothetical protein
MDYINPNYESNTIWVHLGLLWMDVLLRFNKLDDLTKYIKNYSALIMKYKNFLEVYNQDMTPFTSPLYISDDSMVWAANYYYIKEELLKQHSKKDKI